MNKTGVAINLFIAFAVIAALYLIYRKIKKRDEDQLTALENLKPTAPVLPAAKPMTVIQNITYEASKNEAQAFSTKQYAGWLDRANAIAKSYVFPSNLSPSQTAIMKARLKGKGEISEFLKNIKTINDFNDSNFKATVSAWLNNRKISKVDSAEIFKAKLEGESLNQRNALRKRIKKLLKI